MKETKRVQQINHEGSQTAGRDKTQRRSEESLLYLRSRLARVRALPNGYDFFFTGDPTQLHKHAHKFISRESMSLRFLDFDHTLIDNTLLLRITGPPDKQNLIRSYFESL